MSDSKFFEISKISELFCNSCFKYERNKDDKTLHAHLRRMVSLLREADEDIKEIIYLFVEKGAKAAFLKQALIKIQTGEKATDGITSDNEFKLFLEELANEYKTSPDFNIVTDVFDHLVTEVESIGAEINVTTLQSFNSVDATYEKNKDGINEKIKTIRSSIHSLEKKHNATINDFQDEINGIERKMHESNITILGIFSAVVLVFNAAVSFYSSAISTFGSFTTYKIITILLIVGIILVGAMMGLFYFLDRVRKSAKSDVDKYICKTVANEEMRSSKNKRESATKKSTVYILDKTEGRASVVKSLLPFIIVIFLLIAGLVSIFFFWKSGYIERRNQDVAKQINSTTTTTTQAYES